MGVWVFFPKASLHIRNFKPTTNLIYVYKWHETELQPTILAFWAFLPNFEVKDVPKKRAPKLDPFFSSLLPCDFSYFPSRLGKELLF